MNFLLFRLYAPLVSWGDVAVGEFRPTHGYPSRSALLGLIGAALGIERSDEDGHRELDEALAFAVAVYSEGALLRDYHTAQVPGAAALRKRPHRTRADELALPRHELNTILSRRDYRQDALSIAGACLRAGRTAPQLEAIRAALQRPRFTTYLGRKACPPALPYSPQIIEADSFRAAIAAAVFPTLDELPLPATPVRVAWEDGVESGWPQSFSVPRKDALRSRRRWQFGDRIERVALIANDPLQEAEIEESSP
ncbi:MAG: type I-E CRISPR-associated protein Cas5/CasD [Sutterellaceae bacterium]|nr:type I-E CRISPR-associated protein Cas5/CasD [Burkholderiaceae bacterium]MDW8430083.1 type I-E CRISPR-associated protein Cas5/CasD [Sutterellaceae bacterium]